MTHTYEIKGMSCTHCVARVQKAISEHPEVEKTEVSLSPARAVITMKHHVPTPELQALVKKAGGYEITESA